MDNITEIEKICNWINFKDIFWLSELKSEFNVMEENRSTNYTNYSAANRLINELKKSGYIQCCEKSGAERQYILIKRIDFKLVKTGKFPKNK